MIVFEEGKEKLYVKGKVTLKVTPCSITGFIDLHLKYAPDARSGYGDTMFVRVVAVENIYSLEELAAIHSQNFEDLLPVNYFENGGYVYDRKTF